MNETDQPRPRPRSHPQTADEIRADIDSGATGEKVGYPDPAMSPLGTDDEAAGTPISGEQVRIEASSRTAAHDRDDRDRHGLGLYIAIAIAIALVLVGAIWISAG